jgi:hypothetical protein
LPHGAPTVSAIHSWNSSHRAHGCNAVGQFVPMIGPDYHCFRMLGRQAKLSRYSKSMVSVRPSKTAVSG